MPPSQLRSPRTRAILAGIVLACAAGVIVYRLANRGNRAVAESVTAAQNFLARLRTGDAQDFEEAWQSTSTELKSFMGRDAFKKQTATGLFRSETTFVAQESIEESGFNGVCCHFVTENSGIRICLYMTRDGKSWLVEKYEIAMPENQQKTSNR